MNRTALLQVSQRRSSGSAAPPVPPVCGLQGSLQPALLSHVLRSLSAGVCEAFPAIKLREVTGSWKGSPAATGAGGGGRGGGWRWSCVSVRSQLISPSELSGNFGCFSRSGASSSSSSSSWTSEQVKTQRASSFTAFTHHSFIVYVSTLTSCLIL